jgi:hypothetical protein
MRRGAAQELKAAKPLQHVFLKAVHFSYQLEIEDNHTMNEFERPYFKMLMMIDRRRDADHRYAIEKRCGDQQNVVR